MIYKIGDIEIQKYSNGSYAYYIGNKTQHNKYLWHNIPKELGEKLIKIKLKLK